jgi:hypothetical protein
LQAEQLALSDRMMEAEEDEDSWEDTDHLKDQM